MTLRQGLGAAAVGLVVGGAGACVLSRAVRSLRYGVAPPDPLVLGSVVAVLVAAAAAYLPARRAARTDPMAALRYE